MKQMLAVWLLLISSATLAADKPTTISTPEQFSDFTQGYYRQPQPDLIEPAMRFAVSSGFYQRENVEEALLVTFSCLFARHPERADEWKKAIATLEEEPREYFQLAIDKQPAWLLEQTSLIPARNDMYWGCFFATGDELYVKGVIASMTSLQDADRTRYLAAASAQWSLASLKDDHETVMRALKATASGQDAALAAAARDALTRSVQDLRASMVEHIKKQRAAGVW